MPVTSLYLPEGAVASAAEARQRLLAAIEKGLSPLPPPGQQHRKISLYLPAGADTALRASAARHNAGSLGGHATALVWASIEAERRQARRQERQSRRNSAGERGQNRYREAILRALDPDGGIVLAEGATGLGKGRVIGELADRYAQEDNVIVAAPTLQVLAQLMTAYDAAGGAAPTACLLGRQQFVSERRLRAFLERMLQQNLLPEVRAALEAARAWLDAGAGPTGNGTEAFHRRHPGLSHLAEDLRGILAPAGADDAITVHNLLLSDRDPEDDAGAAAHRAMRAATLAVEGNAIVFTTHAGLVWHVMLNRKGWGSLLPEASTLIIDEAHQLPSCAEEAHTQSAALRSIEAALQAPDWAQHGLQDAARRALRDVRMVREHLIQEHGRLADRDHLAPEDYELLSPLVHELDRALRGLEEGPKNARTQPVFDALELTGQFLHGHQMGVTVRYSPQRHYPSIIAGPRHLHHFFSHMWDSCRRAILCSATLYAPRRMREPSAALIKQRLHIPRERLRTFPPVRPSWTTEPVTLFRPERIDAFAPPMRSRFTTDETFETRVAVWRSEVAMAIHSIAAKAMSGTIVLFPGYEDLDGVADGLRERLDNRMIAQERGGFYRARERFLELTRDGGNPVWLAAGPAWTGMDLPDEALSDLVVPRIPFGTENSRQHHFRLQRNRSAERDRAAMQFVQGIGRLVRRPDAQPKRLWVLDGRIWDRDAMSRWLTEPVRAKLEDYSRQTVFR